MSSPLYGLEWGDPETVAPLAWVRDKWLRPYVEPRHEAVEIGPGGGRWTRYMLDFGRIYAVDYHAEILAELRKSYSRQNVEFILNNGTDLPGVPPVDFVFSFGTFVHLDPPIIARYLQTIRQVLKPSGQAVVHYADKNKPMARANPTFSHMTPERMRAMLTDAGFQILEEDVWTMWHSSLVRFGPA